MPSVHKIRPSKGHQDAPLSLAASEDVRREATPTGAGLREPAENHLICRPTRQLRRAAKAKDRITKKYLRL